MDGHSLGDHAHHATGDGAPRAAERRTRWVVGITLVMMVGELLVGWWSGSMALTADGWHMGTHAGALSLTALAYWYARTRADHDSFAFGTGKVYSLAGYTSGVLLGAVAVWMAAEGLLRLANPREVAFQDALGVAVLGLVVNIGCALLLGHDHGPHSHGPHGHGPRDHDDGHGPHGHQHDHGPPDHDHDDGHGPRGHGHSHSHGHGHGDDSDHGHEPGGGHVPAHRAAAPRDGARSLASDARPTLPAGHRPDRAGDGARDPRVVGRASGDALAPVAPKAAADHNLRAAYLHILADAVTSLLAIAALLLGHYAGLWFMDPAMGVVGGAVILWWAVGLCRQASHQLLDVTTKPELEAWVRRRLESIDDVRVADLHVWEIGPGKHGCVVSLVSARPRDVEHYRSALLHSSELAHLTVEVHGCNRAHSA